MEALNIQHYALDTAEKNLLTIDSLMLNQGERVFIIGDNGAGKTSFLKTIIGESADYSGFLQVHGDIAYVPQIKSASPQSGGERAMSYLKEAFQARPSLLILDEPSSYLDYANRDWLINQLKRYRGTLLVVSHDRYLINQVSQKIWLLEHQTIKIYHGNYDDYQRSRQLEEDKQLRAFLEYRRKTNQLKKSLTRKKVQANKMAVKKKSVSRSDWKTNSFAGSYDSQAKAMAKAAKAMEHRLTRMKEVNSPRKKAWAKLKKDPNEGTLPNTLLHLQEGTLTKDYQLLFDYPGIVIRSHSRIAIIGRNKAGKSSFLDQLAAQALSGFYAQNLRITYFKQDQADWELDQTAVELISRQSNQDRVTILNYLAMMGIDYDKANQKVAVLSGGERVRLALVAALLTDHQLLILDEPTTYLDLVAIEALESCLIDYPAALLLVSHDLAFVNKVATEIYEVKDHHLIAYHFED